MGFYLFQFLLFQLKLLTGYTKKKKNYKATCIYFCYKLTLTIKVDVHISLEKRKMGNYEMHLRLTNIKISLVQNLVYNIIVNLISDFLRTREFL